MSLRLPAGCAGTSALLFKTDDLDEVRPAAVLFCFVCFLLGIGGAVTAGFEFLGTAGIGGFLAGALLGADQVLADVEEIGHMSPLLFRIGHRLVIKARGDRGRFPAPAR